MAAGSANNGGIRYDTRSGAGRDGAVTSTTASLLGEQLEYYRLRAPEYDQWWRRTGRYDRGPELNALWFSEAGSVRDALEAFRPGGRVLELACGTGIWTEALLPFASRLTAVDGSPETLALNAARLGSSAVRYVEADIFRWQPEEQFDVVFFAFWLSHVPHELFEDFWDRVGRALLPGGRVFFVDSRYEPTSTAVDHILPEASEEVAQRRLNDGREFRVFKTFHRAAHLECRLRAFGWKMEVRETGHYFLYGSGAAPSVARASRPVRQGARHSGTGVPPVR